MSEAAPAHAKGVSIPAPAAGPVAEAELGARVSSIVASSLGCDPAKVQLHASLMDDLGAESLDFLDIVFELERGFGIQITRGEMERAARGDMSEDEFAPSGVISPAGLERLRELMPEAADKIKPGLRPVQILSLFSVQTFANIVLAKRGSQA
jgi:acyl carrier protein